MAPRTVTCQASCPWDFPGQRVVISVAQPQTLKKQSWTVLWRPVRPSRTNIKKDVLFIIGDWNAKVGSQEMPGVTGKFGLGAQNEAGQRVTEFCQENALVIESTLFQQHKGRLYTWTSPERQYQNQTDCILCIQRWRSSTVSKNQIGSWLWLRPWTPYCQIQKATRPFKYDLN